MKSVVAIALACSATLASAADNSTEQRVDALLQKLTLQEKISLMAGGGPFSTAAITRLGIPALNVSDGPNGVRTNNDRPATVFPTGSALAATWNPQAVEAVGAAMGREARALNVQVILGPNVNIQRSPLAGRNFETYSEDPVLAGTLASALVRGIQSEHVGTSVKHFVANEQELERSRGSSNLDERTLREIYLLPFEMVVKQAHPWTVMASYPRVNGVYMTENTRLVRGVLKGEWGFDGLLMSDWFAVHSTTPAANAGVDLEMPGPPRYFGFYLTQAVQTWQVEPATVDEAARRVLRMIVRSGVLDARPAPGEIVTARHHQIAVDAAREAVVLLKNDQAALPLDRSRIHTLAVIGPNADVPLYQGGGSARVNPSRISTPLEEIRRIAGPAVKIQYVAGADNDALPPAADARQFSPDGTRHSVGLKFTYFSNEHFQGTPARSGTEIDFDRLGIAGDLDKMSGIWEGVLWPPRDGTYEFSLSATGTASLSVDGKKVAGEGVGTQAPPQFDFGQPVLMGKLDLKAGQPHKVRIEYVGPFSGGHSMHFGMRLPASSVQQAVAAARGADAAVVFVGSSRASETEGSDRKDMELAGEQNELVAAVLAANPHTVVVLNNGAPLALRWTANVPAIVEGGFAGEGGPQAVAEVLFGDVNPSGKMPYTVPRRIEDTPAYTYYSGGRNANYGEGVFVGYRYYDKRAIEPLFGFGHGLSYTTFTIGNLHAPSSAAAGAPFEVTVDVRNSGKVAGSETVQLYVADQATTDVVRPPKELKAFQKVRLAPGESRTLHFTLSERDLAYYDVVSNAWVATAGAHRILVGSSSRDIRAQQDFTWSAGR
ncbi:MAG TPA: glycoside hydrolase family 3 C-terminal domain-containing protein [Steroidobacteraceae bacterium]|nr:glycoside hydrolase family 3 C-terminal domain-containing protein [Steroidobacteraceae bacterium]